MPAAWAPRMSASYWSPTCATFRACTPSTARAASKSRGSGFENPTWCESMTASNQSRRPVATSTASADPSELETATSRSPRARSAARPSGTPGSTWFHTGTAAWPAASAVARIRSTADCRRAGSPGRSPQTWRITPPGRGRGWPGVPTTACRRNRVGPPRKGLDHRHPLVVAVDARGPEPGPEQCQVGADERAPDVEEDGFEISR